LTVPWITVAGLTNTIASRQRGHNRSRLDADQRYALTKPIDFGKKSKRARALAEFFSGALVGEPE
jgi:hypothetical protein